MLQSSFAHPGQSAFLGTSIVNTHKRAHQRRASHA